MLVWWIRGLPERQRAQTEGDASLRGDLLARVRHLEEALADEHRAREAAVADEKQRCDEAMRDLRREWETKFDGLMRQFIAAQMAWAEAIPPNDARRTPVIDAMLNQLRTLGKDD